MNRVYRLREAIARDIPLARRLDEPRSPEIREMPRDRRLRDVEQVDDIADAELASGEDIENAKAHRVGKPPKERVEVG